MYCFTPADTNCIQLVKAGIADKLLQILESLEVSESVDVSEEVEAGVGQSPTLQHAVLSALRNLAIPGTL